MAVSANGPQGATAPPPRRLRVPLSLKFVAVLVTLVTLLLLAAASVALWHGYTGAERSALAVQEERAKALAGRIEDVLAGLERQLEWTAQPDWRNADVQQKRADFARMLRQFPIVTELFYIDSRGAEQLKVSRFAPDSVASLTNRANEPRFVETVKAGTWFGPVYVRNGAELSGTVGVAHSDGGATVAEIDLAFLTGLVRAAAGEGGQAFIVDGVGRLIGHAERNPVVGDNDLSRLPQVAAALAGSGSGASTDAVAEGDGAPALAAFARVPGAGWAAIVQAPEAEALAPFRTLLWQVALVALAGLLLAAVVGLSLARRVTGPIRRLQASAERLGEGDLAQRADVRRRDEIGALAEKFNAMANRLQQSQRGFEEKIDDRIQGLDIAQQQHLLTVDMLKTISRADYQLEQVLDALIGSAVRLTEASVGAVWLRQGDAFRLAAQLGHTKDWVDAARKEPFTAGSEAHAMAAAAAFSGQLINVDDVLRDARFAGDYGERPAYSDDERSALVLPLKHAGRVEAVFALSRADPIPFADRQVALAQDFADQALIAIRQVLLHDEVATRDTRLARSSDEQASADEIARLIAGSPADPRLALEAVARHAARFCDAACSHIEAFDGRRLHFAAGYGLPPAAAELISRSFPAEPQPGTAAARALQGETVTPDIQPELRTDALSELLGSQAVFCVPLLKGSQPVGLLTIERREAGPLSARQLELLKAFADQGAIALESARLSEELRARTSALAGALERVAATGSLLQTVSRTGYELGDVLAELGARARRECAADEARFFRLDGDVLRDLTGAEASSGGQAGLARRVLADAAVVHVPDAGHDGSMIGLPLLAGGVLVGVMTLSRRQQPPFDEEQARIASELADQAGLAVAGWTLPLELAQRTAERDEWRQRHAADTEAAEQRRVAEVEEARRLHVAEVDETRERYEDELGEARRLHQEEVAERTAERDEWRQRHAADTEAAEQRRLAEIDEAVRQHAAEMDEARRLHVAEVQEAHQRRETELAEAERLRAEQLDGAVQAHAAELAGTIERHVAELAGTIERHAAELADLSHLHATELGEARDLHASDLAEARRLHSHDLERARLQRSAAAEALKRLADPASGLDAALQAIVDAAVRAGGAAGGVIFGRSGDTVQPAAVSGLAEEGRGAVLAALRDNIAGDVLARGRPLRLAGLPAGGLGARETLAVPLLREGSALGALVLLGGETMGFSEEVGALAESFADQAVIAIETDRLLELAAQRADQLDEARRFREAASRVLDMVGAVEADPRQALDAVVATAAGLFGTQSAELSLAEAGALRPVAAAGSAPGDGPGPTLAVPLVLDGKAAGTLALRREAGFSESEKELAATLAALAAAALAKARLAVALSERTQGLDRALEERRTTARMLATIGRSRFDLRAVLDALARSAVDLCSSAMAAVVVDGDEGLSALGNAGFPAGWPGDGALPEAARLARRAIGDRAPVHWLEDGAHALAVPVTGAGRVAGALVIVRPEPLGNDDIELVTSIADQSAIAIETVRLLDELAARERDLQEAMRQQAATAEGLKAISRSTFDLDGVLSMLAASAAACSGAAASTIHLMKDGALHLAAAAGLPAERLAAERDNPVRPGRSSWVGRAAAERSVIHMAATAGDVTYPEIARSADAAAVLALPLMRDGVVAGVFTLTRPRPGPFSERQIGLVQGFADQALIAAETVRLAEEVATRAGEVNETLRQQTAIAYVLRTIARSGFDLDRVLATLTASAATLCNASSSEIYRPEGDAWLAVSTGASAAPALGASLRRAALEKAVVHELGPDGADAALCVPLLRDDEVAGLLALTRPEPFTERQVELVRSFADQASIAIETARLAASAEESAGALAEASRDLHSLQKRVGEMERLASLGQATSGIAAEIRASLDSLKDFSARSDRMVNEIRMVLEAAVLDSRVREEVEDLGDTLKAHLDKVVEFGKRADSIVVNMLKVDGGQDEASAVPQPVSINALVDESLGIASHGARAERPDFDVSVERSYDAAAGEVELYPQEMARALLYLFTNAFQALARRKAEMNGSGYRAVLAASTRRLDDAVEIVIRDNGTGIPPGVKAKMFDPFFTTKPAGEGTGLGLSLGRDIIVHRHAGSIEVETEPGAFTEFRIRLPRKAPAPPKALPAGPPAEEQEDEFALRLAVTH